MGAVVRVGQGFLAGYLAFAQRVAAVDVDVRSIQGAVAARRGEIDHASIVDVDHALAQLGRGWVGGVDESRRGTADAGLAQAAGQQVVGDPVIADRPGGNGNSRREYIQIGCARAAATGGQQRRGRNRPGNEFQLSWKCLHGYCLLFAMVHRQSANVRP